MAIDPTLRIALFRPRAGLAGVTVAELLAEAGGGGVAVEDEGNPIVPAAATLNFIGALVSAVDAGADQADITIDGALNDLTDVTAPAPGTDTGLFWTGLAWEPNPAIVANPDSLVTMFNNINAGVGFSFSVDSLGANLRDHTGSAPNEGLLRWIEGIFVVVLQARLGFDASDDYIVENSVANGEMLLRQNGNDATIRNAIRMGGIFNSTAIGFQESAPIAKPAVVGSRGANVALADLLTQLDTYGLITDSTVI